MAPRTTRWLQERQGDAPTKGLAWPRIITQAREKGGLIVAEKEDLIAAEKGGLGENFPRPEGIGAVSLIVVGKPQIPYVNEHLHKTTFWMKATGSRPDAVD